MDPENHQLQQILDSKEAEALSMVDALKESGRAHQDYKNLQQKFLELEENTMKKSIAQKNQIARLKEVTKEKEDQLKVLKEKCAEHEYKKSLHKYLDQQCKGVASEETKASISKKSH